MASKGGTFSSKGVEAVLSRLQGEKKRIDTLVLRRMEAAVTIVHRTASARRPMMSKAEMKAQGRTKRVSDPNALAGVPVQTGALQASIQKGVSVKGGVVTGRVWTDNPYAAFVEWGTSRMPARPFMRPALALQIENIKKLFNKPNENA